MLSIIEKQLQVSKGWYYFTVQQFLNIFKLLKNYSVQVLSDTYEM
jgi:hypothetical protein